MNKLTKLLSVFVIAGALGAGVAGVAGCAKKDNGNNGGGHTHNYTWVDDNNGKCHEHCSVDGCDTPDKPAQDHVWGDDNECDHCGATKPGDPSTGLVIPADVTGLLIEGVESETITLSETNKSHTIDKSAIHVYFATGNNADVKGTEVPAENLVLELKDGKGAAVSSWENITKGDAYKVNASIKDAEMASGAIVTVEDLTATVTVTVSNPVVAGSLVVKAGATLTQPKSVQDKMTSTWEYEVTHANGDKEDVPAAEVKVTGLDTNTITAEATATLTWGTITGTVKYSITENANLRVQSYAYNFGADAHEGCYDEDTYLIDNKGDHTGTYVMIPGSKTETAAANGVKMEANKPRTSVDGEKFFTNRLTMGGGTFDSKGAVDSKPEKKKYIVINAESAGKITIYWSRNSSTDVRGLTLWTKAQWDQGIKIAAASATGTEAYDYGKQGNSNVGLPVGTANNYNSTKAETLPEMATFTIPAAGTYYLTTATNQAAYLYYIQIDNEYSEGGVENVVVEPGSKILSNLAVSHSSDTTEAKYKQQFNLGDTFTVDSGFTFKGTSATANTAAISEDILSVSDLEFWLGETQLTPGTTALDATLITTTGDQIITVKKDGVSVSYVINVASALGIDTISVALSNTLNTLVATETDKVNVAWEHLNVTANGTNDNVDVVITGVTYVAANAAAGTEGTAIAETGTEIGVGEWVITVTATVTDKTNSELTDTFTATCNLGITVAGSLENIVFNSDQVKTLAAKMTAETVIINNANGKIFITADATNTVTMDANNKSIDGNSFTHRIKLGGTGTTTYRSLGFEVKAGAKIVIYAMSSSGSDTRTANLLDAAGNKIADTATTIGTAIAKYEFTVTEAGTYYFAAETGGTNVYGASIIYNA